MMMTIIHSFILAIYIAPLQAHFCSEALPTQHGYCDGVSRRIATGNCELKTCPRSLPTWRQDRLKVIDSTNAPPRPIHSFVIRYLFLFVYRNENTSKMATRAA